MLLEQLDSYKLDITAIQELRWLDKGVMEKRNHVIFNSCLKKSHMFGIGFIVSKKLSTLSWISRRNPIGYVGYELRENF
jgi:hypothetical protein